MPHLTPPEVGGTAVVPTHLFDITIIGGGPVGLFGAFYAGMRQMSTKIIDSLEELGGQLTTLYPEKYVFDVAGFPKVYARDLAKNLIEQAMEYRPTICLGETVHVLESLSAPAENEPPEIQGALAMGGRVYKITSDKGIHYTRTLVISAGAGAFSPKKLTIKEAPAWENRGVFYACKSKSIFADKRVLIVGGGDSAMDWAMNLRETALGGDGSGVTLIHRSNRFRAHEDSVRRVQATKTTILTFCEIESLVHHNGTLTGVILNNSQTKEKVELKADAVLVQIGFNSSLGPIKNWPLRFEKGSILVDTHMETNLPGIFAAGDVAAFPGKLKLIATGFGEAAIAVNIAKTRIDPHAKLFPGHSSEMSGEKMVTI